jgi:hypothetical protein
VVVTLSRLQTDPDPEYGNQAWPGRDFWPLRAAMAAPTLSSVSAFSVATQVVFRGPDLYKGS